MSGSERVKAHRGHEKKITFQTMRLSPKIHSSIKSRIHESIPSADVFLFGSRVDDSAKGGDIDLLLLTEEKLPLVSINRIRRLILNDIGEQKIDIVNFTKSITHPFKSLALESAIRL
jgi:predicted nucleotidyltransferase